MSDISESAAIYGRMNAMISFYSMIVFYICMVTFAIITYFRKPIIYLETKGTISNVNCYYSNNKYTCDFNVDYVIDNKKYNGMLSSNNKYINGSDIKIYYNSENLNNIYLNKPFNNTIASSLFIIIAFIVLVISYLNYYFSKNSTEYSIFIGLNSLFRR